MKVTRIILLLTLSASVGLLSGYYLDRYLLSSEIEAAVEQCTAEVAEGCPLLYQYLTDLERENARLNVALNMMGGSEGCPTPPAQATEATDDGSR